MALTLISACMRQLPGQTGGQRLPDGPVAYTQAVQTGPHGPNKLDIQPEGTGCFW